MARPLSTTACWVCGGQPHRPTPLHDYISEAAAYAQAEREARRHQPTPPPLIVDGEVVSYAS